MSTRRARQRQWIVLRQKASRHLKRQRGIYRTEPLGLLQLKPADWQHLMVLTAHTTTTRRW